MKFRVLYVAVLFFTGIKSNAQASTFHGWLAFSHEQEISEKWILLSDIQFRSAEDFHYLETILLRPGISYKRSADQSVGAGYAYLGNRDREDGKKTFEQEHRVWEQYNIETKINRIKMTNRLRLEQRFLKQEQSFDFAQRLRYFVRGQIPLTDNEPFNKGTYLAAQNEVFVNIQNKEKANNHFFDQNRTFAAFGYRFSKALDIEGGYLYRYQIEETKEHHHIIQLMISTSL